MLELGPDAHDEARTTQQNRVREDLGVTAAIPRRLVERLQRTVDLLLENNLERVAERESMMG